MRMRNLRQNHPLHVYMMETIFGVARSNVPCAESIPPLQQTALDASPPTLQMKTGAAPQVLGMTAQAEVIFPWMAPDTLHWRLLVAMMVAMLVAMMAAMLVAMMAAMLVVMMAAMLVAMMAAMLVGMMAAMLLRIRL